MGSLRNPIGPLPSSIYWRRRAVALSILAALVLLAVWALTFGGDESDEAGHESGNGGRGPSDPITPGPSNSESGDDERPGGRDEGDGGADSAGGDGGSGGGDSEGSGGSGGSGGGTSGGALGGSSGSVTGGGAMPAGSDLPVCDPGSTEVELSSAENEYAPGDEPEFTLTVRNDGGEDCRIDLGRTATVLKISDSEDNKVWSSDDCPPNGGSAYVQVPAGGKTVQELSWDRKESKPGCGKEPADPAGADTYLVEASVRGLSAAQTSFVLAKD
ncbi:hypothetical protein [Streptomyces oceani]|uniref:DUF4232 domain-containing protein n=1 Tax=Streptomyces oceani TaxID=1075402 RepID=A0A1E7JTZ2_9ACTN|nr:hypothetical protein [Streptomyces oceani]OEU93413.1 hypothetical protein AN216_24625 [Streptomyces oceani]